MTISSAYQDFCVRTLEALAGVWRRLGYVAELRAPDGRYQHWGMARTYGDAAAQRALAQAHTELFLEILRMPLREQAGQQGAGEVSGTPALPAELEGGTPEHFNSVVSALAALAEARRSPNPGA